MGKTRAPREHRANLCNNSVKKCLIAFLPRVSFPWEAHEGLRGTGKVKSFFPKTAAERMETRAYNTNNPLKAFLFVFSPPQSCSK